MKTTKKVVTLVSTLITIGSLTGGVNAQDTATTKDKPAIQQIDEPTNFSGIYKDLSGAFNITIKPLGKNRFSMVCEDWEATLLWSKNTKTFIGTFRYVDQPKVEKGKTFQKGGVDHNASGFIQVRPLPNSVYQLTYRWWLTNDEASKSWTWYMTKNK